MWASTLCYVSMPFRAYTPFSQKEEEFEEMKKQRVNALPGLYSIFTNYDSNIIKRFWGCQCPSGLILHFHNRSYFWYRVASKQCVNALPGLYSIFTRKYSRPDIAIKSVSMPFRAYTPFSPWPKVAQCLCGLLKAFLHIIIRIFWQKAFLAHFFELASFPSIFIDIYLI